MTLPDLSPTGWLIALVPVALALLVLTLEVGMALTIGNMPADKTRELTAGDRARIKRVWIGVGLFWPIVGVVVGLHLALPTVLIPGVWLVLLAFGARWVRGVAKKGQSVNRTRRGLCHRCGYDLRGSVHRADCPECGIDVHPRALEIARRAEAA